MSEVADVVELNWVSTRDIALMMRLSQEYVTDEVVKRAEFPKPVVNRSQRVRFWDRDQVVNYLKRSPARAGRRRAS